MVASVESTIRSENGFNGKRSLVVFYYKLQQHLQFAKHVSGTFSTYGVKAIMVVRVDTV